MKDLDKECCDKCYGRQGTTAGGGIYCNDTNCPCHNTLDKEFDKEFRIMEQVNTEEVDGVFALESDRDKVKSYINKHYISKKEVEGLKENANKYPMKNSDGTEAVDWNRGYRSAMNQVLALQALKKPNE